MGPELFPGEVVEELQGRVEELERELHEGAADAIAKLAQIRKLATEGCGKGHARWWPWWVQ